MWPITAASNQLVVPAVALPTQPALIQSDAPDVFQASTVATTPEADGLQPTVSSIPAVLMPGTGDSSSRLPVLAANRALPVVARPTASAVHGMWAAARAAVTLNSSGEAVLDDLRLAPGQRHDHGHLLGRHELLWQQRQPEHADQRKHGRRVLGGPARVCQLAGLWHQRCRDRVAPGGMVAGQFGRVGQFDVGAIGLMGFEGSQHLTTVELHPVANQRDDRCGA